MGHGHKCCISLLAWKLNAYHCLTHLLRLLQEFAHQIVTKSTSPPPRTQGRERDKPFSEARMCLSMLSGGQWGHLVLSLWDRLIIQLQYQYP